MTQFPFRCLRKKRPSRKIKFESPSSPRTPNLNVDPDHRCFPNCEKNDHLCTKPLTAQHVNIEIGGAGGARQAFWFSRRCWPDRMRIFALVILLAKFIPSPVWRLVFFVSSKTSFEEQRSRQANRPKVYGSMQRKAATISLNEVTSSHRCKRPFVLN